MRRFVNSLIQFRKPRTFWNEYYERKRRSNDYLQTVDIRGGYKAIVPGILMSAFDEVFLRNVYQGSFKVSSDSTIIDIGANVGYFTLYAFKNFRPARVLAIEAMPFNCELLEKHKEINNLQNLEIVQKAVTSSEGQMEIGYQESLDYSVGASMLNRVNSDKHITVETMSLDSVFEKYNVKRCALLKVDCEGAEYDIFLNASADTYKKIDNVVMELHDWVPKDIGVPNDLKLKLESNGFKVQVWNDEIMFAIKVS